MKLDDKTKKFFKMLDKDLNEQRYHLKKLKKPLRDGRTVLLEQEKFKTIRQALEVKNGCTNVYYAVNDFDYEIKSFRTKNRNELQYRNYIRQSDKVKRFNSFYVDIDFKINDKHLHNEELQARKDDVYNKLINLKLKPSAVVESRNGFHVYYIIDIRERYKLTLEKWKQQEKAVHTYLSENVSDCVDPAVKDAARVLRLPLTYHKKDDSDKFIINVKYVSQVYSLEEISNFFKVSVKNDKVLQKNGKKQKKTVKEKTETFDVNENDIVNSIIYLDDKYFSDFLCEEVQEMKWNTAVQYINSYDMIKFLNLDVKVNESFCSCFREDKNPSCIISYVDDVYYFRDFTQEHSYSLIGLVCEIAQVRFTQAVKFLAKCLNVKILKSFDNGYKSVDEMIEYNKEVFKSVAKENTDLKFMFKLMPLYDFILKRWNEEVLKKEFNNASDCNLQLSSRYVADKANLKETTARKYLNTLECLQVIKQILSKSTVEKFGNKTNTYLINRLDKDKLTQQAKKLNTYCNNKVLSKMSADFVIEYVFSSVFNSEDKKTA